MKRLTIVLILTLAGCAPYRPYNQAMWNAQAMQQAQLQQMMVPIQPVESPGQQYQRAMIFGQGFHSSRMEEFRSGY